MDIRNIPTLFGLTEAAVLTELSAGHINRTFLAVCGGEKYVLQSLNSSVFRAPEAVMDNIERVTAAFAEADCDTVVPHFIASGDKIYAAADGEVWRMYRYITAAADAADPAAAGRAFGSFIRIMDGRELCSTPAIEGFHDLDRYLCELEAAGGAGGETAAEIYSLRERLGGVFGGGLKKRIIHGDAKPDNVIMGSRPAIIDLDTVMYGYAAVDYGDLIRSVCRGGGAPDLSVIQAATKGFAEGTGGLLTDEEIGSLYHGILWITGELAVRYLTDSLREDKYFKGKSSADCLSRVHELIGQLKAFYALSSEINEMIRSELMC